MKFETQIWHSMSGIISESEEMYMETRNDSKFIGKDYRTELQWRKKKRFRCKAVE